MTSDFHTRERQEMRNIFHIKSAKEERKIVFPKQTYLISCEHTIYAISIYGYELAWVKDIG